MVFSILFTACGSENSSSTGQTTEMPDTNPNSLVENVLKSGEVSSVTEEMLLDATLVEISKNQNRFDNILKQLFDLNPDGSIKVDGSSLTAIDWDPTHDAATLKSVYGMNIAVLRTNDVTQSAKTVYDQEIGIIGETPVHYMVLGSNPMRNHYRNKALLNEQMHKFLENSLGWLTERENLKTSSFNVVIAHMHQNSYFPDEVAVRAWLDERYPGQVSYNIANSCEDNNLDLCLKNSPDILIISQNMNINTEPSVIANAVQNAMNRGIPVLYMHYDGGHTDLGKALFPLLHVTYEWDNYWKKLQLTDFNIMQHLGTIPSNIASIQTMLKHFKANDYAFNWSLVEKEDVSAVTGLDTEFSQGANAVRSMMKSLDESKMDLFTIEGYRLEKQLALLGDKYRQSIDFPIDKEATDDTTFLKSYFADHAVYNYRTINPVQPDMGNFSRSDFSHITPIDKTVDMESKKSFRSAGVYALPGKTVRVTRQDSSELTVKIAVNSLRSGSTHQWATNGYSRPKYLQSPKMKIEQGETIYFTSPYGGPIQVHFSANDLPVKLHFENIGVHPYWRGSQDNENFTQKLEAGDYDWAEMSTPAFEVHSTLEKMRQSVREWDSAANLADKAMTYSHNYPLILSGFQGPNIDQVTEIHDFATENGWTINTVDNVKHMNADQATCGYGCSGNPYDAYWNYSPIGHGDIHEIGHGLERHRMRFSGWEGHAITNPYSYYSKSHYNRNTGGNNTTCQSLPFESIFNTLQASVGQVDSITYLKTNLWDISNWSHQVSMTIQMMMNAQKEGKLQNGWHMLARLHMLDREFIRSDDSDEKWLAGKDTLGFSTYSRSEAKEINNNDWIVIAVSYVTGLDYRDFISAWGQTFSQKASDQVANFRYPKAPVVFFTSGSKEYCEWSSRGDFLDKPSLPIDGNQSWPDLN